MRQSPNPISETEANERNFAMLVPKDRKCQPIGTTPIPRFTTQRIPATVIVRDTQTGLSAVFGEMDFDGIYLWQCKQIERGGGE